ncbi:MAG: hypothetical protein AAFX09_06995 [Pseudomonadota bacterium]
MSDPYSYASLRQAGERFALGDVDKCSGKDRKVHELQAQCRDAARDEQWAGENAAALLEAYRVIKDHPNRTEVMKAYQLYLSAHTAWERACETRETLSKKLVQAEQNAWACHEKSFKPEPYSGDKQE